MEPASDSSSLVPERFSDERKQVQSRAAGHGCQPTLAEALAVVFCHLSSVNTCRNVAPLPWFSKT
jgi:hypothetical protein